MRTSFLGVRACVRACVRVFDAVAGAGTDGRTAREHERLHATRDDATPHLTRADTRYGALRCAENLVPAPPATEKAKRSACRICRERSAPIKRPWAHIEVNSMIISPTLHVLPTSHLPLPQRLNMLYYSAYTYLLAYLYPCKIKIEYIATIYGRRPSRGHPGRE